MRLDEFETLHQQGVRALESGDGLAAVDALLQLTSLRPDCADAHRELGRAWLLLGQAEEATASLHHAMQLGPDRAETSFYLGCALQAQNRLEEAALYFQQAVHLQPDSAEARNNLGTTLAILGRYDESIPHFRRALALRSNYLDARRNLDAALRYAGKGKGAAKGRHPLSSQDSPPPVALSPGKAPSRTVAPTFPTPDRRADTIARLFQRAFSLQEQERLDETRDIYLELLALAPDNADAHNNLGLVHYKQGHMEDAELLFRRAITLSPDNATFHSNLGNALMRRQLPEDALSEYRRATELQPDFPEAWNNGGTALLALHRYEEARTWNDRALALKPDYPSAWNNRGNLFMIQHKYEEAEVALRRAIALQPDNIELFSNLGATLMSLGQWEEGEALLRKAIARKPAYAAAHSNLGNGSLLQGRYEEAEQCFRRAIAISPQDNEFHLNLSMALLNSGDFAQGWQEYEWRHEVVHARPDFHPRWNGEPLEGRALLVCVEQGMGDTIQFARYLPLLKTQAGAGRVIFECYPELTELLKECEGIDEMILLNRETVPNTPYDAWIQLMSLPGIFRTDPASIPAPIPYLYPDPGICAVWKQRLQTDTGFKVGIVWAGNPSYTNDRQRSCRLTDFARLADLPNISLYSLQKGETARTQLAVRPDTFPVTDLAGDLQDFRDTAAAIASLDLVITVDTAVAHLAGALGQRTWTLLPCASDWRWLCDREDSPWYPTMRLFRQSQFGDWPSVFARVTSELRRIATDEEQERAVPVTRF